MAVGLGIILIVLGLILVGNVVNLDMSHVDDGALGGIFLAAGILAIVLSLVINAQRSRGTHRTIREER
jgi:hypothetical protein